MLKRLIVCLSFFLLLNTTLQKIDAQTPTTTTPTADINAIKLQDTSVILSKINKYLSLSKDDEKLLSDLFSVNIGIMKFKYLGNIRDINPLDSQNIVSSIKNELDKVKNIKLDKKAAVLKAIDVYKAMINTAQSTTLTPTVPTTTTTTPTTTTTTTTTPTTTTTTTTPPVTTTTTTTPSSTSTTTTPPVTTNQKESEDKKKKDQIDFLKQKLFFTKSEADESLIYEIFLEFQKNEKFFSILQQWVQNIENPFYSKNLGNPFERTLKSEEEICNTTKINEKGPVDFLFYGEMEKVDTYYFINLYVYSNLLKKRVAEISYAADSSNITQRTMEKLRLILPKIFHINYASLTVTTNDEEDQVYLDKDFIGRNNVFIDYIVPGRYVVTLKKENYIDKLENVTLDSFEDKKITLNNEQKESLQLVNFMIEPYGTQIFLNSVYQGRTPFKKALPKGNYILFAKNDLYENHRYTFVIDKITNEENDLIFHLKTKDIKNYFAMKKNLYYAAFWNFTFSMIATIPLIVFTKYYYDSSVYIDSNINPTTQKYDNIKNEPNATLYTVFYGITSVMLSHTVISLGLLFAALGNYLITLEKKDFIPILEFYKNQQGKDTISLGGNFKF